ncbi:MAG: nucleotidyltransferase domain-containing protein, partial [Acidobacteriota bacterium]
MADVKIPKILRARKSLAREKVEDLRHGLLKAGVDELLDSKACVYLTGSLARGEASEQSDLDIFMFSDMEVDEDREVHQLLDPLDLSRLQSKLIDVANELGFPPFSNEGEYLVFHSKSDLVNKIGHRDEDYTNILTARLLLLLESTPILGEELYSRTITQIIGSYWRDYERNEKAFLPVFLTNDIVRFWKVLCLNYEANSPPEKDLLKRRVQNYKLRHSRLLTCFSAILQFLWRLRDGPAISPEEAVQVVQMQPIERLIAIANEPNCSPEVQDRVHSLLEQYARFLEHTTGEKGEVRARFDDESFRAERRRE